MKIPESIRLNGVDYKVEKKKNLNDGIHMADGLFDARSTTIFIDPEQRDYQQQCITFLHEVCHAIMFEYHVDLNEPNMLPKDDEVLAETFARGVYQFLQDNARKLFDIKEEEPNNG